MIGVINYGLGNIQSFLNSYRLLGVKAIQVKNTLELNKCDHLILPGVGSFDAAMTRLKSSKLIDNIEKLVFKPTSYLINKVMKHPPAFQFTKEIISETLVKHGFKDIKLKNVRQGKFILQYGIKFPTVLTPVQTIIFSAKI